MTDLSLLEELVPFVNLLVETSRSDLSLLSARRALVSMENGGDEGWLGEDAPSHP